jgi:hypothetical protein
MPDDAGAELGNLFVVLEVLVSGRQSEDVADLIIGTIGEQYYNTASHEAEPLAKFEAAIKALNHQLADYVSQGNAAWIGKLSAMIAVQVNGDLHVSHTGSAEAFLYRGKAAARLSAGEKTGKPAVPSKTFGSIASGQLEPGDRLLLATPALVHQLSLAKLKSIVNETTPNGAIAEITELLRGGSGDRIAALVIEVTTPELAALQVRSDQPDEIQIGTPENAYEAAKMAAAPLAEATVASSKRVHGAAKTGWQKAQPHARQLGLRLINVLREFLTGPGAKKRVGITLAAIIILAVGTWQIQINTANTKTLLARYQAAYTTYQAANLAADSGDKTGARQQLTVVQNELKDLSKYHTPLDNTLKKAALAQGEPATVAAFTALVASRLDDLEALHKVDISTVASFASIKNSRPTHLEIYSGKAYVIDGNNNSAIYVVNITTNSIKTSAVSTAKLGTVVATTLSSNNDGIYILTKQPGVWFYKFDTDTLTEQSAGLSGWPTATAIASYAGNLYLLGDGTIYKHVRTISGFSPKSVYLDSTQASSLTGATTLAVDGAVYALSPAGLSQFLSGTLKTTSEVPASLAKTDSLRSAGDGSTIVATDSANGRIGLWSATASSLVFDKQYQLNGAKSLMDAGYDTKNNTIYALVDNRLVKFTP